MNEFDRIATYLAPLTRGTDAALGLTDDAALWQPPPGRAVVLTTDTMVSGCHYLDADGAEAVAAKLLRVNLSDLAAMGATPFGFLLNTALGPHEDEAWLAAFAEGLGADIDRYGMPLLGGDSVATPGPAVLTVTAIGTVQAGRALRRNGAAAGDDIYVSGTVGDAGLGLAVKLGGLTGLPERLSAPLLQRLHRPEPRLALGRGLAEGADAVLASACIDLSDGLLQDLGHVARQSGLSIRLSAPALPLSEPAAEIVADMPERLPELMAAGDDYELAFTAPSGRRQEIASLSRALDLPLTRIGEAVAGPAGEVVVLDATGAAVEIVGAGYQHFS
ncbi:thiamine-phosphate kinase [Marinibaculum pumilum]|uniref:Thiamine-monophosphate kinase n=1 Tax=Marinibaculum pumilum TaxID=1766165 RepID=A0ABV7KU37_9PROT